MIEIDAFAVRSPLRLGDNARRFELGYLVRLATARRDEPEIVGFEQSTVGDERKALAIGRKGWGFIFERSICNLFWLAPFGGQKMDVIPTGVLQDAAKDLPSG